MKSITQRASRAVAAILLIFGSLLASPTHAANFTVGGSISNLVGSGLVLRLDSDLQCIADNGTFTLNSTDTNDCFTPVNFNRCCSQSIKFTATDGISTVTCTCGVIIPGGSASSGVSRRQLIPTTEATATQTVSPPANATSYTFGTAIGDTSTYTVSVDTQPSNPAQTCTVANATGTVSGANVTNANVTCTTVQFTVSASGGPHGTVAPPTQNVNSGSVATVTITPDPGYSASASGCGGTLTGTSYTTAPVTAACAVSAVFTLITLPVTASGGPHGTVTPPTQDVNFGAIATVTITPGAGFRASASGCGGTLLGTTYTTAPITAACAISAVFTFIPVVPAPAPLSPWHLLMIGLGVLVVAGALWRRFAR